MAGRVSHNPVDILDKDTLAAMNFNVLRRIEPETEQLLATAGHVALYDFSQATGKWAHKGVEGTLFLIKRRSQPFYQYIVLNKKSQDHYVEDILDNFKFEHTERDGRIYLLYKNRRGEVVGVWFYDKVECTKVVALLKQVAGPKAVLAKQASGEAGSALVMQPTPQQGRTFGAAKPVPGREDGGAADQAGEQSETAFWDQDVAKPMPEAGLLQQDGLKSMQTAATNAAVQQSSGDSSPARTPGEPNALERLFGNLRNPSASGATNSAATTPQIKGLPPFKNAEQVQTPTPRSTAAATPMSAYHTPLSMQKGSSEGLGHAPSGSQLPPQPALLKPSFFQGGTPTGTPTPREPTAAGQKPLPSTTAAAVEARGPSTATPSQSQSKHQDAFLKFFGPKSTPTATPQEAHADGTRTAPQARAPNHQALVRSAVKALADSDKFIEVLVRELEKSGLLRQLND